MAVTVDVLANDGDVDGDVLTVAIDTNPANGSVVANPDQTITYTPNAGFSGSDQFTYVVDDSNGGTATATVTVEVAAGLSPPLIAKGVVQADSSGWTTVSLAGQGFTNPVIIATPNYVSNLPAMVTRITNVGAAGFDLKVQPADAAATPIANVSVYYIVVEAGIYTVAASGVKMEVRTVVSDTTAENNNWNEFENVGYLQSYANPVVVGQVMSNNDADWSAFYATGSSRTAPPSSSTLRVGKHVGEDADTTRADETVGFIVIEAGTGTIGGLPYEAGLGNDTVKGVGDSPSYNYSLGLPPASYVAAASQAGMDGGNGGWAMLYGSDPVTPTQLRLAIEEDQMKDSERKHTTEQVGYFVIDPPAQQGPESTKLEASLLSLGVFRTVDAHPLRHHHSEKVDVETRPQDFAKLAPLSVVPYSIPVSLERAGQSDSADDRRVTQLRALDELLADGEEFMRSLLADEWEDLL